MPASLPFLDHGGEMAARIRAMDWAATPLGRPEDWPAQLKFAVDLMLSSRFPAAIYWGRELRLLYNDAWAPIPAERHPAALGRPGSEVWADIWDTVGPQMEAVLDTGQGFAAFDQHLPMERGGRPQDTWWNYSFTPIRDESGTVVGILNQGNETSRAVLSERARLAEVERLREFFEQAPGPIALLHGPHHVFDIANPAYLALVGGREVLGKSVAEALPEVVAQGFVDLLDQVYRTGIPFRANGAEVLLQQRPDAEPEIRHLDFVYQPIVDSNGNSTDILVAVTDVTERTRAESELRRSQERLQLALESSVGIGTWFWDIPENRVTADTRFLKLYGVDPALAQDGAPVEQFFGNVHPEDLPELERITAEAIRAGGAFSAEYRLLQADGSIRWVSAQGHCTLDAEGRALRLPGVSFDITERKAAEEAARAAIAELRAATETQAFLHALTERLRALATPEAIMHLCATALGTRLGLDRVGFYRIQPDRIEFGPGWSNGALPLLEGDTGLEAMGQSADSYREGRTVIMNDIARERPGSIASRVAGAGVGVPMLRGGQWVAVFYANTAATREWTAEEIALVEAVAQSSWDAVERALAVLALRESESKFRAIANSIDPMIWSTLPDGYHDYFNDRWYEYTGAPPGSSDGEGWHDILHPEDRARARNLWTHCLKTGDFYRIEYRLRHRSGQYRWVLGSAQPVRDESGAITRWFGTCTDIQDIVDAREVLARSREELEAAIGERTAQLMAAEERLRQAHKMEAVGQLTGGIAHDFNNMLAVVIGALDLLERRIADGRTDIERYVIAARDGATRAAALTHRLLAFSRQQPLAPVAIDVNRMVEGMIELLTRTLGEAVTIETALPDDLAPVLADPNQLENVILNLAVNGRDAMPDGGRLTIATAARTISSAEAPALGIPPGAYIEIAVRDRGIGMDADVAARAFDPFFTTKGVGKGTGLGLSQVFGFLRQSGGAVEIDTAPGRGTVMRVLLPVHRGAAPPPESQPAEPALPRAREGETILVVEDEERVRSYSVEALRELGYHVIDARDGPEALEIMARGQPISLLFSDVVMPEMGGPELAARAREMLPGLKVLLTSGYTPESASDADRNILGKPFDLAQLANRVRAALDD